MAGKDNQTLGRYDDVPDLTLTAAEHAPPRSSYEQLVDFQQGLGAALQEVAKGGEGAVKQAYAAGYTLGGVMQIDPQALKAFNDGALQTYQLASQLMDPKILAAASDVVKAQLREAKRAIDHGDSYAAGALFGAVLRDIGSPKTALDDLVKKAATIARHPMESATILMGGGKISDVNEHVAWLKSLRHEVNVPADHGTRQYHPPTEEAINNLYSSQIQMQALAAAKARAAAKETMGKWELLLTNVRENIGWGALISRYDQDRLLLAGEKGDGATMQTVGKIVAEKMAITKVAAVPLGMAGAYYTFSDNSTSEGEQQAKAFVGAAGIGFKPEDTLARMAKLKESGSSEMKDAVNMYLNLYEHLRKDGAFNEQNKATMKAATDNIAEKLKAGEPVIALGARAGVDLATDPELALVR